MLNFETVKVEFEKHKVIINNNIYNINEYRFEISYYGRKKVVLLVILSKGIFYIIKFVSIIKFIKYNKTSIIPYIIVIKIIYIYVV